MRHFFERLVGDPEAGAFVAELHVGEQPVAYELGFRMDDKLWSYDGAYDSAWAEGSPGMLLTAAIIEDGCASGLREYDFMRGDEAYKLLWTSACRDEMEYVLDSGKPRGSLARQLAFQARWRLRRNPFLVAAKTSATGALTRLLQGLRNTGLTGAASRQSKRTRPGKLLAAIVFALVPVDAFQYNRGVSEEDSASERARSTPVRFARKELRLRRRLIDRLRRSAHPLPPRKY
jgi:hypothetical protein